MNARTQRTIIVGSAIVAILSVVGVLGYGLFASFVSPYAELKARRTRLLCETDFPALLGVCRELSRKATPVRGSTVYTVRELSLLPELIRTLRPTYVTVCDDGMVTVELAFGGITGTSFGVCAYPEGATQTPIGDRKLIQGLWYYDEGYRARPDSYGKIIEQLLAKSGKPAPE